MKLKSKRTLQQIVILLSIPSMAFAHNEASITSGFISGFVHPILGIDHLIAMVAVGIWGAQLGSPSIWILSMTFPLVMTFGGALGLMGVQLPSIEMGIALSAVLLGLMIAAMARPPVWIAALLISVFAIFHGYAHGVELPHSANPFAYVIGFVIATACLHLTGILFGHIERWPSGGPILRYSGGIITTIGSYYLYPFII